MQFSAVFLFLSIFVVGCTSANSGWDVHSKQEYRLSNESNPKESNTDLEQLLSDPALLQKAIDELNEIHIGADRLPIKVTLEPANGDQLRILAVSQAVQYNTAPENETERARRELHNRQAGLVQLNTVINRFGENQNAFLKQQQANLVAFLFQLPAAELQQGTQWQLPVTLTSLSTAFIGDKTRRINKVWVHSFAESNNGPVAEIVYLLAEYIEGHQQQLTIDNPVPFVAQSGYFAVGQFEINTKRWRRYAGRLESSFGAFKDSNLIVLLPVSGEVK